MFNKIFDKIVFSNLPPSNKNVLWIYPIDSKHYDIRMYSVVHQDEYTSIKKWTSIGITDIAKTELSTDFWYVGFLENIPTFDLEVLEYYPVEDNEEYNTDVEDMPVLDRLLVSYVFDDLDRKNLYFDTRQVDPEKDLNKYYTVVIPDYYKINSIIKENYYEREKIYQKDVLAEGEYLLSSTIDFHGKKYTLLTLKFYDELTPFQITTNVVRDLEIKDFIVQERGYSIDRVMSQNAVTKALDEINKTIKNLDFSEFLEQELGDKEDKTVSQKAITEAIESILPSYGIEMKNKILYVNDQGKLEWSDVDINIPSPDNPGGGGGSIADGSVTTSKIADGAVTETKLSSAVIQKLNSGGGTYIPNAGDEDTVNLQSIKAEDLKGKPYNEVLDILLFPEYDVSTGTLPSVSISNPSQTLEVGTTIENASYSSRVGTQYKYIKEGSSYIKGDYTYTPPTVTTTKSSDKVQFGVNKRETASTSYTVTGPTSDKLYEGQFLYKSKGKGSNIEPLTIGTTTKSLDATSVTITGVYKGGKNGIKSDYIYINYEGKLLNTISGTYKDTLTYNLLTETAATPDHLFSDLKSKSVELYVPEGKSYTVKLIATKYNSGTTKFENDKDLTASLNSLTVEQSYKTFQDAAGNNYSVTSYLVDTSNIGVYGKFVVDMKITKT